MANGHGRRGHGHGHGGGHHHHPPHHPSSWWPGLRSWLKRWAITIGVISAFGAYLGADCGRTYGRGEARDQNAQTQYLIQAAAQTCLPGGYPAIPDNRSGQRGRWYCPHGYTAPDLSDPRDSFGASRAPLGGLCCTPPAGGRPLEFVVPLRP